MKKINSQKGISPIIAVVILAIILIGGGAYYFKQQQAKQISKPNAVDATANWQMYTNTQYGFEIKYPNNWLLNHNIPSGYPATTLDYDNSATKEGATITIGKIETIAIENGDIKLAEKEINQTISNAKTIIKSKSTVKVGNYNGYEMIGTFCTQICTGSSEDIYAPFSYVYFSDGKKVVQIGYSEGISGVGWKSNINDWKYYAIYKQILSTFKFTDQNQTISQADIDAIKQALLSVVKTTKENLIFDIDTNLANQYSGMFASGHEGARDAAGGGVWIAAKVNGAWQIVSHGNGVPVCAELNPYNVPSAFAKTCVNSNSQIINR